MRRGIVVCRGLEADVKRSAGGWVFLLLLVLPSFASIVNITLGLDVFMFGKLRLR